MKGTLRDLFTFSSGERKGIIALVFVLIVISGINMFIISHQSVPVQSRYPDWMLDTGAYEEADNAVISANDTLSEHYTGLSPVTEPKSIIDPNTASMEDLLLAGLSLRIAKTVIKYREKGGKFRTPEDLKKIYGLTPEMFRVIEPYIKIRDLTTNLPPIIPGLPATININTADSVLFDKLPGIGPVLARRIIRYRKVLGGYYSPEQLREVYGISDSLFICLRGRLAADTAGIKKININTTEEKDLAQHPYVGKYAAAGIVKYRLHAGKIMNINELNINGLIPKDKYEKLKYYISL
jgi:competence protein ComEA